MKLKLLLALIFTSFIGTSQIHKDFQEVQQEIPTIAIEVRYFGTNNFIGTAIDGYLAPKIYATSATIIALKKVQEDLSKHALGLKIFDAYRPQKAVDHFVRWAKKMDDTLKKQEFYPKVPKSILFQEGYIAAKSGHTRGSTVDVTIIDLKTGKELDMGSPYDMFDPISWVKATEIKTHQMQNRKLLQKVMLENGFKNYPQEWWHFTIKNEPFPTTYFDFNIE